MLIVCKTLVLVERKETAEIVSKALELPKFETVFTWSPMEARLFLEANPVDLFVVSASFRNNCTVRDLASGIPTLYIEASYIPLNQSNWSTTEEAARVKASAERLLRKNYINWVVDALEYTNS
ncbi:MAG: hypothetical protein ACP5US_04190 [Candidatus Kryptoniota bacterium]